MSKVYKIILKPRSFFGHIFTSDTIFGAVSWAVRDLYGEAELENLLDQFNDNPPFLLSSLMPQGYVPRPVVPSERKDYNNDIPKKEHCKKIAEMKKRKKMEWIPFDIFRAHQNEYDDESVMDEFDNLSGNELRNNEADITRNAISRENFRALEGALFTDSFLMIDYALSLFVRIFDDKYGAQWLNEIFENISKTGIGKDKSVGRGAFEISVNDIDEDEKDVFEYTADHFMSLSLCAGNNLNPLSYTTLTKYGKLDGEFSQSGIFSKKPVVFYRNGSTFVNQNLPVCGAMIKNIHNDERIMQYGYAFPIYFNMKGKGS